MNEETGYTNYYACTNCGETWVDEWSCACDDDCPTCGTTMSPYYYECEDDE